MPLYFPTDILHFISIMCDSPSKEDKDVMKGSVQFFSQWLQIRQRELFILIQRRSESLIPSFTSLISAYLNEETAV